MAGPRKIHLQKILERQGEGRPLVLLPPSLVGALDLSQTLFAPETSVVISRSKDHVSNLREENPGVQIETAQGFVKMDATRWSLVVVMGPELLGNPVSKIARAVMYAQRKGARVVCLGADAGKPQNLFWVARALGVHKRAFGNYEAFRYTFLLETGPFHNRWVYGVKEKELPELWARTKTFLIDFSKEPEHVAA